MSETPQDTPPQENAEEIPPPPERVESGASRETAVRRYIVAAGLFGFGVYCAIDAFLRGKYPYAAPGEDINAFLGWAFNHVGGVLLPLAGLLLAAWTFWYQRSILVADPEGIGYKGKTRYRWDQVQVFDATKLKKGVVELTFDGPDSLVIDTLKRDSFRDLIAVIEDHVPEDRTRSPE